MNFHADPPKEFLAGLGLYFPLISTRDVSFQPYVLQIHELFSGLGAVFDFLDGNYSYARAIPEGCHLCDASANDCSACRLAGNSQMSPPHLYRVE